MKIPYVSTEISPERTQIDIKKMLQENGIRDIQWTTYKGKTSLRFVWMVNIRGVEKEILFQFVVPNITTLKRTWDQKLQRYAKTEVFLEATSYRLLWHYLRNKLEAVRWGLESMEKEFLSHAVVALPSGEQTTIGERINQVFEAVTNPALEYTPPKVEARDNAIAL